MTNRLKSLELIGYKTFASKSRFEFEGDITAIVGPNGSGKSNIADSLRWVLGEQSFRLLRGRKTDDMIFSGSESRPRAGMASATVTFDNSDGWLPIDFSEVSITRRAYRDGNNEYLINGQRVRLRDVNELLASSGLAERTYTVIGQGLVDAALTLKAEERRRLFEEAAGIGLYRSRKDQALRRLDNTKRNLERVEDILSELSPRLRSLRRQAQHAEEYEQVRDDLQEVLREWYGYHWHKAQQDLSKVKAEVAQYESSLTEVRETQEKAEQSISGLRDRINTLRSQLNSWHRQLSQIHSRREETSKELAVSGERRRALLEQEASANLEISRLEEELSRQDTRLEDYKTQVDEARQTAEVAESELNKARTALTEKRNQRNALEKALQSQQNQINRLNSRKTELEARKTELENRIARLEGELQAQQENLSKVKAEKETLAKKAEQAERDFQTASKRAEQAGQAVTELQGEIDSVHSQQSELKADAANLNGELVGVKAELDVLVEAEASMSGYASGAKVLLQAAQDGRLSNAAGALGSQLQVPENIELAVAAALGDYVDAVLLSGSDDPESALKMLESEPVRAALLPLDTLSPLKTMKNPGGNGVLGVAADLVEASAALRPAVDLLLGQVIIVEDRQTARRILKGQDNNVRAVTLKGEVFYGSGAIMVDSGMRAATLRRPRQRKSLEDKIVSIEGKRAKIEDKIKSLAEQETALGTQLEEKTKAASQARAELRQAEHTAQQARLAADKVEGQVEWLSKQRENLSKELTQTAQRVTEIDSEQREVRTSLETERENLRQKETELAGMTVDDQLSQVSYWEAQVSIGQQSLNTVKKNYEERKLSQQQAKSRLGHQVKLAGEVKAKLVELDWKVQEMRESEGGIGDEIKKLNDLIEPAEKELAALEAKQTKEISLEADVRSKTSQAERHYNQAQIVLARRQEALDTLRQRIETDFGLVEFEYTSDVPGPSPLPFGDVVQRLQVVEEVSPELEDELKQKRMQLRRLGSVNPDAKKEYQEVSERHEFLTTQMHDLRAAEKDIREVITELDELMNREFRTTFEIVAEEFKHVFTKLFAGGAAKLVMTEAEDINDVGIDIEARLPGKRTQALALLSGGERSLTAAALVFALIKASPTPFCVMDEVDAMLDEANVGRFRQVLEELSDDTQFVVITHNRHTVQAADVIYGITMGRDTTSQSISLRLEEVDERYSSN